MKSSEFTLIVLFGGVSSEHEPSVGMFDHFRSEVYSKGHPFGDIATYYLARDGRVFFLQSLSDIDIEDGEIISQRGTQISRVMLCAKLAEIHTFVYSLLQGQEGEDGTIQGVLRFLNVPGNAGAIAPSVLSIDKYAFGTIATSHLPVLASIKSELISKQVQETEIIKVLRRIGGSKVIVRPNSQGASVLTEVFDAIDIRGIVKLCSEITNNGDQILIQEFVFGTEITCGCLRQNGKWIASNCFSIITTTGYMGLPEKTGKLPYDIQRLKDESLEKQIQKICVSLSEIFDFHTQCRYDLIWNGENIFILECNSKPGLLEGSIYPKMLSEMGVDMVELIHISFENEIRDIL